MEGANYHWKGSSQQIKIKKGKQTIAVAKKEGKFFWLHSGNVRSTAVFNVDSTLHSSDTDKEIRLAHVALGHASPSHIKTYLERTIDKKVRTTTSKSKSKTVVARRSAFLKRKELKLKLRETLSWVKLFILTLLVPSSISMPF